MSNIDEVKAAVQSAIGSFNAGDYQTYSEILAENLESYAGIVTPLLFEGKAAWMTFIGGMEALASAIYEQRQISYRSFNSDTVLYNAYFVFTTVSQDGLVETQTGRVSVTCVKVNGTWLIANQHYSPMF